MRPLDDWTTTGCGNAGNAGGTPRQASFPAPHVEGPDAQRGEPHLGGAFIVGFREERHGLARRGGNLVHSMSAGTCHPSHLGRARSEVVRPVTTWSGPDLGHARAVTGCSRTRSSTGERHLGQRHPTRGRLTHGPQSTIPARAFNYETVSQLSVSGHDDPASLTRLARVRQRFPRSINRDRLQEEPCEFTCRRGR